MITQYWSVQVSDNAQADFDQPMIGGSESAIAEAGAMLREGKLVAFPTETVYGLGANALDNCAVERIFIAKGRPSDNPLIVHVSDQTQLDQLIDWQAAGETVPLARQLMQRFWPGPLTLVLPAMRGVVSKRVTAGLPTVAVRMPDHLVALALIRAAGCPVAAPSANRSGKPSPTLAAHVRADLAGRIDGVVDGGATGIGLESTVVELLGADWVHVLRPGAVTAEALHAVAGRVTEESSADATERAHAQLASPDNDAASSPERPDTAFEDVPVASQQLGQGDGPRSPGMKYAHYAPQGYMCLVEGSSPSLVAQEIHRLLQDAQKRGEKTGVLAFSEYASEYQADFVVAYGGQDQLAQAAQQLYGTLRQFDEQQITFIIAEACPDEGIGRAIMNRLRKATAYQIIRV